LGALVVSSCSLAEGGFPLAGSQDDSTNEDRFGRQDRQTYSRWSSLIAIVVVLIVVGLVFFFAYVRG
jgi:hypothetical protein